MSDKQYTDDIMDNRSESEMQAMRDQREWYALIPMGTLAVLGIRSLHAWSS